MWSQRWRWNHWKVNCTLNRFGFRQLQVFCGCWKCTVLQGPTELSCWCLIEPQVSVPFRFTPQCHPCCGPGGRTDLCPAGRSDMVRVQEGRSLFPGPPHLRQRLLQTNQHTVVRVGWKCAHHRHKCILRTIAPEEIYYSLQSLRLSTHHFPIRDINALRCCNVAVPTPQDSDEVTTTTTVESCRFFFLLRSSLKGPSCFFLSSLLKGIVQHFCKSASCCNCWYDNGENCQTVELLLSHCKKVTVMKDPF